MIATLLARVASSKFPHCQNLFSIRHSNPQLSSLPRWRSSGFHTIPSIILLLPRYPMPYGNNRHPGAIFQLHSHLPGSNFIMVTLWRAKPICHVHYRQNTSGTTHKKTQNEAKTPCTFSGSAPRPSGLIRRHFADYQEPPFFISGVPNYQISTQTNPSAHSHIPRYLSPSCYTNSLIFVSGKLYIRDIHTPDIDDIHQADQCSTGRLRCTRSMIDALGVTAVAVAWAFLSKPTRLDWAAFTIPRLKRRYV